MVQLAVLKLDGNLDLGFNCLLTIGEQGKYPQIEIAGSLPSCPQLKEDSDSWNNVFSSVLTELEEIKILKRKFRSIFNQWLSSSSFRLIERKYLESVNFTEDTYLIIRTQCTEVLEIPWYLWDILERKNNVQIILSPIPHHEQFAHQLFQSQNHIKILSIIEDKPFNLMIEKLAEQEGFLHKRETNFEEKQIFWEEHWTMLFLAINSQTNWDLLKQRLKQALNYGLQIVVIKLGCSVEKLWDLASLDIPLLLIINEEMSWNFCYQFLEKFIQGKSFYLAIKEARLEINDLDNWLPFIIHEPSFVPPTWKSLQRQEERRKKSRNDTVTLVFTDLVNSTAIKKYLQGDLEQRNYLYLQSILQPHRQQVEANLKDYHGRVVKTEGDAYFLVFANAIQAVKWAVNLQITHQKQPIQTPFGILQVRIGIHTGSPLHDGADFIGQEVDYAARVSGLANGEQILLSEVTSAFISSANLKEISIYHHGYRNLKGIGKVPIFEVLYQEKSPQILRGEKKLSVAKFGLISSLLITVLIIGIRFIGLLQSLELQTFDYVMRLRPDLGQDPRLLIIEITEADIKAQPPQTRQGSSSISDETLTKLIEKLNQAHPAVIGLDLFRDFPVSSKSSKLAQLLTQTDNFIGICSHNDLLTQNQGIAPTPEIPKERLGFADIVVDQDNIVRRYLWYTSPDLDTPCPTQEAFSLKLALIFLEKEGIKPIVNVKERSVKLGFGVLKRLPSKFGGYQNFDNHGYQMLLNYRTQGQIAPTVTLRDILEDKIATDLIRDKIIMIGVTAESIKDEFFTPFTQNPNQTMKGVSLHGQMVSQIISTALDERPFLQAWHPLAEGFWLWFWSWLSSVLVWQFKKRLYLIIATVIALIILSGLSFYFFVQGWWLPFIPSLLVFIASLTVIYFYRWQLSNYE
jgi:CHASE2 domain-containing sensor protein/class 3 adenylate cyclase